MTHHYQDGGSFSANSPENLTHCDTCGVEFTKPITDQEVREDFGGDVESASYLCSECFKTEGAEPCLTAALVTPT